MKDSNKKKQNIDNGKKKMTVKDNLKMVAKNLK